MHNKCYFVITRMDLVDMVEVYDKDGNIIESFLKNRTRPRLNHMFMHKGYEQLPKKKD